MEIVLELLVDSRCEVRQNAGEVLSGFIHHNLIKDIPSMIVSDFGCNTSTFCMW